MAKMIEKMLLRMRLSRLERLRSEKNLTESYLRIKEEALRTRTDLRLAGLDRIYEAKIAPLAEAAGTPTSATLSAKDAKIAALRERYRWKEKAVVQSRRRVESRHPLTPEMRDRFEKRLTSLTQTLETKIETVRAIPKSTLSTDEALRIFKESQEQENRIRNEKSEALRKSEEQSLARLRENARKRVARLDGSIGILGKTVIERHPHAGNDKDLPDDVLLRLKNLSMRFGGLLAVDNLSFDVKQGEIFGLIGPNGAGKTTIFNCITRFYRATSGEMFYRRNPVEVIRLNDYPVHHIIRQGIVRTFQNVELVWELTVLENLLVAAHTVYRSGFFAQLFHTPGLRREENVLRAKAMGVLNFLGLGAYAQAYPYGLPYGILKKIELARTLMAHPRLIILDEPAAGLNDKETEELAVLIRKIREEYHCTIFLVEHDMGLVMDICDTVCAISFGKMLAIGTPAEIQANALVRGAYLGEQS